MSAKPVLVQCDFDGTVTIGDVSFQILDEFTGTGWRSEFDEYMQGKITVNRFNTRAFSRVNTDRATLDNFVREHAVVRPGLHELLAFCQERGYRFVIVSNGMAFYIETILSMLDLKNVEFIAGLADFSPQGMSTWYPGPDGKRIEQGFKEAWTARFLHQDYRVIYIGNGASDFAPARQCAYVFSIDNLTTECQKAGVTHSTFNDLHDITRGLEQLE